MKVTMIIATQVLLKALELQFDLIASKNVCKSDGAPREKVTDV